MVVMVRGFDVTHVDEGALGFVEFIRVPPVAGVVGDFVAVWDEAEFDPVADGLLGDVEAGGDVGEEFALDVGASGEADDAEEGLQLLSAETEVTTEMAVLVLQGMTQTDEHLANHVVCVVLHFVCVTGIEMIIVGAKVWKVWELPDGKLLFFLMRGLEKIILRKESPPENQRALGRMWTHLR